MSQFLDVYTQNLEQIRNSTVLVRVCYDLSNLEQTARIRDSLPTIFTLLQNGNKVVLLSHWGRPKGVQNPSLSLKKQIPAIQAEVTNYFETFKSNLDGKAQNQSKSSKLNENALRIKFFNQYDPQALTGQETLGNPRFFEEVADKIEQNSGRIFVLENTRFHPLEKSKDPSKRKELAGLYAKLGQYFVDEAFPVSHRKETTNTELAELLPAARGLSYGQEIRTLTHVKENPAKPFVLIMGGAKFETKLPLIQKLLPKADKIIVGGLLSFTFVQAGKELGLEYLSQTDVGDTPVETDFIEQAKELLRQHPDKIVLPFDYIYDLSGGKKEGVDTGPQSLQKFKDTVAPAKTIFWNGPIGFYEKEPYNRGTLELAEFIANLPDCYKVAGGGDITTALPIEIIQKFNFASMGGGATLEFLSK